MPISTTTRKTSPFTGNGSLTSLPFAFKVFAASDVEVIRTTISTGAKTTLVLSTDYTVTLNADQDVSPGGVVTLNTPLAATYSAIVASNIPQTQPVALANASGFFPNVISAALDRATALVQQVQERLARTPALPKNDTSSWPEIPVAVARANTVLGFGSDGTPALIPKADFVGPAGPAGADGAQGPQGLPGSGGVDGDGLPLTGGTMTGDITMKADGDGGVVFARSGDDVVQGRIGRNNDAIVVTAVGAAVPLQLGANGVVRLTVQPGGAVRFEPLASAPSSPAEGWVYSDSTNKRLRWHNGTEWRDVITEASPTSAGPLTLALIDATNIAQTTVTLAMDVAGEIPSGALMQIQYTTDIDAGPWVSSSTPSAARGRFSANFTGLTAGVTYYFRGFVYPSSGPVYATTVLKSFTTQSSTASNLTAQFFIDEAGDENEVRFVGWGAFQNDPAYVTFTGGSNSGKEVPAVNYQGPIVKGDTSPAWWQASIAVLSAYKDSDLWDHFAALAVIAEQSTLSDRFDRQHTADNCAVHIRRSLWAAWRRSTNALVTIRNRTDQQGWFRTDDVNLFFIGGLEPADIVDHPDGGVKIRWNRGANESLHFLGNVGANSPYTRIGDSNRNPMDNLKGDMDWIGHAIEMRLVAWDDNLPFDSANAKLAFYSGIDAYPTEDSVVGSDSSPGDQRPGICAGRIRSLTTSFKWATCCTLRDTMRQDHEHSTPADAGLTAAGFLAKAPAFP